MVNPAPVRVPKKSNLSSPLVKAANKITTSPTFNKARTIDFDKKVEYKRFIKFIESSNQELLKIKLPNAGDVKKSGGGDDDSSGGGGDGLLQKGLKFLLANVIGATLVKILKSLYKKLIPKKLRLRLKKLRIKIIKPFYKFNKWIKNTRANIKNFFKQSIDDMLASVKKNIDDLAKSLKNSFDDLIKYLNKLRKFKFKNIKPVKTKNLKINPKDLLKETDNVKVKPKGKINFGKFFNVKGLLSTGKEIGKGFILALAVQTVYDGLDQADALLFKNKVENAGSVEERDKIIKNELALILKQEKFVEDNPRFAKMMRRLKFVASIIGFGSDDRTDFDVLIEQGNLSIEKIIESGLYSKEEIELLKEEVLNDFTGSDNIKSSIVTNQREINKAIKALKKIDKNFTFDPETQFFTKFKTLEGNVAYKLNQKEIIEEPKINVENLFNSDIGSLTDFNYADLMKENPNLNTIPFIMKQGDNNIFLSQPNNGEVLNSSNVNFKISTSMIDFDIGKMDSIMFDELYNFKLDNGN